MAYDRYLAICRPLHYPAIMTRRLCGILVSSCWLIGFLGYPIPIFSISQLPFCGSNIIDHFLCDMDPLMVLCFITQGCFSGSFCSWSTKGLLYLWFSSSCGITLLWDGDGNVCESYIWHPNSDAEDPDTCIFCNDSSL
ncbi:Olfactory receptor 11H4 [Lemmus lemmus]